MRIPERHAVTALSFLVALLSLGPSGAPQPIPVIFGPNINLSDLSPGTQGRTEREPTVAVNPVDPMNLVEGHIDRLPSPHDNTDVFSFSSDGGRTWTFGGQVPLQAPDDAPVDPILARDAAGNFYYPYIENDPTGSQSYVVVAKSTDRGRTFPSAAIVRRGVNNTTAFDIPDKEFIAADAWPGSRFRGNLYVGW